MIVNGVEVYIKDYTSDFDLIWARKSDDVIIDFGQLLTDNTKLILDEINKKIAEEHS